MLYQFLTPIRGLGRTDLVKLLKRGCKERKEMTPADSNASRHKDAIEDAGASSILEGPAAVDPTGDAAAALDPAETVWTWLKLFGPG